ncbi:MAG: ABC transporter substrate-binding protein [Thiotrichales bacterium]|nr:ABC transporter substrate-binding protein [Thiotrichales bacterium]
MSDEKNKSGGHQSPEISRIQDMFKTGGLNRREFMQGLMATGLSVTAAGVLVAGTPDALAMTPKKGGKITFGWDQHGPADTLDPGLFTSTIDYARGRAHFNNLLQFNDDTTMRGELAEEWSSNANATEFTFKLRKGVKWHDGTDFNADDVVYSMNRHIGENAVSKAKGLVSMITEWKKVDSHTVKAILSSPNSDLPQILGTFHFKIIQNGGAEKDGYWQLPVGTGPYKTIEFTPGVRSRHVRNDDYWREGANLDELEIFAITDNTSRVNALISGDIDIMGNLDPKAIKQVEASPGVEVFGVESGATTHIGAMLDREPTNNHDFVTGLKFLQPRQRLVRSVLKGQGGIGNDHTIGPSYSDHCFDLPIRPHDPDQAAFHLKKSGVTSAVLHTAEVGLGAVDMCLVLQAEAAKVGFDLKVKRVPGDGYWGTTWMNQPLSVTSWNMRPTANVMMSLMYKSDAPWNECKFKSERFDELLLEVRGVTDKSLRQEMYCEMQTLVHNDGGNLMPFHRNYVDAISSKVKGIPKVPLAAVGGCEFPEFVWLDS